MILLWKIFFSINDPKDFERYKRYRMLVDKLEGFVKNGLVPCRYKSLYSTHANLNTNCFIHAFYNLSNTQLKKLNSDDSDVFGERFETSKDAEKYFVDLATDSGLVVDECKQKRVTLKGNQWRVAYYFSEDSIDYHFILEEKDGYWSQKEGFNYNVSLLKECPMSYTRAGFHFFDFQYLRQNIYIVTNPYAEAGRRRISPGKVTDNEVDINDIIVL